MGDTPNIAARLQGLAALNTVVLSAAMARLLHGVFTLAISFVPYAARGKAFSGS
jgi:class 3 adenylate cyclase